MSYKIHEGDCIQSMRAMPDQSVQMCVTSPPYFGLRDYGHDGQIGLEETPEEYVAKMVEVFREVLRVLRDDGTLWLNLGDSYVGSANNGGQDSKTMAGTQAATGRNLPSKKGDGLKSKDLIGIPWRVALALQADGWYLRQDIIWHKPNPMPESVTDRCTKAHEYVFLLSKSARYYFDSEAMQEQATGRDPGNVSHKYQDAAIYGSNHGIAQSGITSIGARSTRNRRSVWTVSTKPYKGAHFATFPTELIRPCILAGCPADGTVIDPFGGSGTTAQVAIEEGRNAILCELNADYIKLAHKRMSAVQLKAQWGEVNPAD